LLGTRFTPNTSLLALGWPVLEVAFISVNLPTSDDVSSLELSTSVTKLLAMYPDNPAAGSPYGTGQDTFGNLTPAYKKAASISELNTFRTDELC